MGGSTTTNENSSSQSINEIPQWVQNAGQANYGLAQQVASQPLQQYQGQMVADVSPQMQQSWNLAANSGNVGVGAQNAAQAGYLNTLGQTPQQVTPYYAGKAAPTVAAQGALAAPTTAATAGAAQQGALAPNTVAAQAALSQLSNTNLQPYMSPYTQSVINATLPIMQQGLAQSQNQQQNAANSANAYGGSRQAIQQGVTQAQGALAQEQMAAQLNQANFAQAQAAGEFDVGAANQMGEFNAGQQNTVAMNNQTLADQMAQFNAGQGNQVNIANAGMLNQVGEYNQGQANAMNQFNAQQGNQVGMYNQGQANAMSQFNAQQADTAQAQNQAAGLTQEQLANAASSGLGNLGSQQMQNNLAQYGMLASAGGLQGQQQQNDINAQIAKFNQAFTYPQQQLGMMESSLGMTPYNTGTSGSSASQTTQTQNNPAGVALSAMQMLGGLYSGGIGNSLGTAMGGGVGSDRRLKTDIKRVGTSHGVPIHAYRYKGDPKHYPKVVGPMAEDVEKKVPGSTAIIPGSGGRRMVHPAVLGALTSSSGAAKAIGMLSSPGMPGRLSPMATPPTRMPIVGALGG